MIIRKDIHLATTILLVILLLLLFAVLNIRIRKEKEISLFGMHGSNFSTRVTLLEQAKGFPYIFVINQNLIDQSTGQLPQDVVDEKTAILEKYENKAQIFKKKEFIWNLLILFLLEVLLIVGVKNV